MARGHGLAGPSDRLRATLFALLADLVQYELVRLLLEHGNCWVGVSKIESGLLNFRLLCALKLEVKIQVGINPICVSAEGHITPCCTIVAWLPTPACASMHAPRASR